MARVEATDPRIGTELAGYRIEGLIGRGGMSTVYKAEDLTLRRKVALKLMSDELSADESFRERFRAEWRLAASIDHPNVIPIHEAGESDGTLFIAMRYVEGTDLKDLLKAEGALEAPRAISLVTQASAGLDAAHKRGLVHRDIKPSNVLIARDDDQEHVYLADFGLTKPASSQEEARASITLSGSSDYVSPEQISEGSPNASSDIYSLGALLYETLTGEVPYPRDQELQVLWAHLDEPPPKPSEANPDLPHELDAVIATAMAKEPEDRYATGAELATAAQAALPTSRFSRRTLVLLAVLLVALIAAAIAIPALLLTGGGEQSGATLDAPSTVYVIDAETGETVSTIPLEAEPDGIAAADGAAWIIDERANVVRRIDAAGAELDQTGFIRRRPSAIDAGHGEVWVSSGEPSTPESGLVVQVDPETSAAFGEVSVPFEDRGTPFLRIADVFGDVAIGGTGRSVWLTSPREFSVKEIRSGRTIDTGTRVPRGLAVTDGAIWVSQVGRVLRIDPAQGEITAVIELDFSPLDIVAGNGAVWVSDAIGDAVVEIDRATNRVFRTISVGDSPGPLAATEDGVWVGNRADQTLSMIDPEAGTVATTTSLDGEPRLLAMDGDRLWVVVRTVSGVEAGPLSNDEYSAQVREIGARLAEDYSPLLLELREAVGGDEAEGLELFQTLPLQMAAITEATIADLEALEPAGRFSADHAAFIASLRSGIDTSEEMAAIAGQGDVNQLWEFLVSLNEGPPVGSELSPEFRQFFAEYFSNFP